MIRNGLRGKLLFNQPEMCLRAWLGVTYGDGKESSTMRQAWEWLGG